jgi:hypothetical protein
LALVSFDQAKQAADLAMKATSATQAKELVKAYLN